MISCFLWCACGTKKIILRFTITSHFALPVLEQDQQVACLSSTTPGPQLQDMYFYFNRIVLLWTSVQPAINLNESFQVIRYKLINFLWLYFINHFNPLDTCTYHLVCPCNNCHASGRSTFWCSLTPCLFYVRLPFFTSVNTSCSYSWTTRVVCQPIILSFISPPLSFVVNIGCKAHNNNINNNNNNNCDVYNCSGFQWVARLGYTFVWIPHFFSRCISIHIQPMLSASGTQGWWLHS